MFLEMAKKPSLMMLALALFLPCSLPAKVINGEASLVTELSKAAVGSTETLEMIKASQNHVKKEYKKNENVQITWGDAVGFTKAGDRFYIISFSASIVNTTSEPAIFSLLYEKKTLTTLEYTNNYFAWVDPDEIKAFNGISQNALCSLFENQAGISIRQGNGSDVDEEDLAKKMADIEVELRQQLSQTAAKSRSADNITEGKLKESMIDNAICRDSELSAAVSALKTEIAKHPLQNADADAKLELTKKITEVEDLKARIGQLEETLASLAAILKGISREGDNLVFSGMNLYVESGAGATDAAPNGLGNLIVGYNEPDDRNKDRKTGGSHNLIVGKNHTYTSYGGFVVGASNKVTAPYSSITGGLNNSASGAYSCVGGGQLNTASGDYATVGGGLTRKAEGNNNWTAGEQSSLK